MIELLYYFVFFMCSSIAVASALNLVFNPNPVYGALGMAGCFFVLSIIYILINQGFFASIQLLVYAGAIMVLFLFIIMLLNLKKDVHSFTFGKHHLIAFIIVVALFAKLFFAIYSITGGADLANNDLVKQMQEVGSLNFIGKHLFDSYLLPFEFIAFLLLIAVVGAVLISKKNYPPEGS